MKEFVNIKIDNQFWNSKLMFKEMPSDKKKMVAERCGKKDPYTLFPNMQHQKKCTKKQYEELAYIGIKLNLDEEPPKEPKNHEEPEKEPLADQEDVLNEILKALKEINAKL